MSLIYYRTCNHRDGRRYVEWESEPDESPTAAAWVEVDECGEYPAPDSSISVTLAECEITTDIIPEDERALFNDGESEYEPGQEWHRLKRYVSICFTVNAGPLMEVSAKIGGTNR